MDVIEGSQDIGADNPVPELIEEETLLDEVDIPGLPLEESEGRRQWRKLPSESLRWCETIAPSVLGMFLARY